MPADRRLLPRPRRRRGRNELAVDRLAGAIRTAGAFDEVADARIVLARTLGAALDRLEDDPERSEHTVGSVGRVQRDLIADLAGHLGTHDALDDLLAALDAPADGRNPAQP